MSKYSVLARIGSEEDKLWISSGSDDTKGSSKFSSGSEKDNDERDLIWEIDKNGKKRMDKKVKRLNKKETKIDNSDDEQIYESKPRKPHDESWRPEKASTKLPIKLPDGKLVKPNPRDEHKEEKSSDEEMDSEMDQMVEEGAEDKKGNIDKQGNIKENKDDKEKTKVPSKIYVAQKQEQLATIAQYIIEEPEENIGQLKILRQISKDDNPMVIKLAFLTQLAVYKDIIPGYRIRPLSEKEKFVQVSKEVKKLRKFEQELLSNYKAYLESLHDALKADKKTEPSMELKFSKNSDTIAYVALQCMCTLLISVTHFNFRLNLMTAIVERMSTKEFTEMSAICCDAIIEVYQNDESGEASLDAVKLITRMIKAKSYIVHEEVVNTFLHLRLRDELHSKISQTENDAKKNVKKRRKEEEKKARHVSRKMRKLGKERREVEREMKEAEAIVDREEKEKRQTETLKLVFVAYFRILKHGSNSPLFLCVLEGLAKFAHLINVEFFDDLLEVLKKTMMVESTDLINDGSEIFSRFDTRKSLLCVITAFELLSGQGEALNIDLKDFYTQMYAILLPLALNPNMENNYHEKPSILGEVNIEREINRIRHKELASEQEILMRGFDFLFFRSRQIPIERSAAFLKRLSIACLNWPSKTVIGCLEKIEKMIQRQTRLDSLLTSEDRLSNGIYLPKIDDPELSNPFATSLWELNLLGHHYDPEIQTAARALANFVPNTEKGVK